MSTVDDDDIPTPDTSRSNSINEADEERASPAPPEEEGAQPPPPSLPLSTTS